LEARRRVGIAPNEAFRDQYLIGAPEFLLVASIKEMSHDTLVATMPLAYAGGEFNYIQLLGIGLGLEVNAILTKDKRTVSFLVLSTLEPVTVKFKTIGRGDYEFA
jgi:hypothetical protein